MRQKNVCLRVSCRSLALFMVRWGKLAYCESGLPVKSCWEVLCVLEMFFVCLCGAGVLCAAALVSFFSTLRLNFRILSLETDLCPLLPHHLLIRPFLLEL